MKYDCSFFQYNNITPPNMQQQLQALGSVGYGVGIAGIVTTLLLVVLFVINVYRHILKSPAKWRRLLAWITSTPMVVSFLSLIIFFVPRAGGICDTVKQVYLPFVLMHFIDLALMILGGEEGVIRDTVGADTPLSLCTPPLCCFGICLRKLTFSKIKLRIIRGLIYQAPVFQLVLIITMTVLELAELTNKMSSDILIQVLSFLNILAFMMGIWGFNIANKALRPLLAHKWERSILKSRVLGGFIILLKTQNFVLGILDFIGVIPCVEPYVSDSTMQKTIDAGLTMMEAFLFGVIFYIVFRAETAAVKKHSVCSKTGELILTVGNPASSEVKKNKNKNHRHSSSSSSDDERAGFGGYPTASPATLERRHQLLLLAAEEDYERADTIPPSSPAPHKTVMSLRTTEC